MPGHLTPEARAISDALEAGAGLQDLTDALYEHPELQGITRPVLIDVGARVYLICQPAPSPLTDTTTLVSVGDEIA